MLYILTLTIIATWMVILIRKKQLSWHAIVASYSIAVISADMLEVTFNLLLNLYKFPTHLSTDPHIENELGIIFADTLILPFTLIVFVYYARKLPPWRVSLLFALVFISLEWIFLKLGYITYIRWSLAYSAAFYFVGFRIGAFLAPRIANYDPPVPYRLYLLSFSHTTIMWFGAILASPLLQLYQFKPGWFQDYMADCRFISLLSGDLLAIMCTILLPMTPSRYKVWTLSGLASMGFAFSLYAYYKGWLIYHHWNHFLMALRYFIPFGFILLYDRWELAYRSQIAQK